MGSTPTFGTSLSQAFPLWDRKGFRQSVPQSAKIERARGRWTLLFDGLPQLQTFLCPATSHFPNLFGSIISGTWPFLHYAYSILPFSSKKLQDQDAGALARLWCAASEMDRGENRLLRDVAGRVSLGICKHAGTPLLDPAFIDVVRRLRARSFRASWIVAAD